MISAALPPALKAALQAKLEGLSRSDAANRAALISKTYREGDGSGVIRTHADALAYALARMPATYAAAIASLDALSEIRPDFAPQTLLDVGAGPGTASFAAAEAFPTLDTFAMIDRNDALRALALDLVRGCARMSGMTYAAADVSALAQFGAADLVIANYAIGEFLDADRSKLIELMWHKTRDTLLLVEPGTPAGFARIMTARTQLIGLGAHVAAPCPHDGP
ncbi:MAG: small ribosomal subunit Rsm22 family protein, partial [Bradyrhizobium sp.]